MKEESNSGKLNKVKLICAIIFIITTVFFVIKCIEFVSKPVNEFIVEQDSVSFEETVEGVLIRKETLVKGNNYKNGMVQIVSDGKKTAKGEKIFRYYSNGEDKILAEIQSLSKEINEIIESTEITFLSSDIASIEVSIEDTINNIYELNDTQKIQQYMKKIDEYMDTKTEKTGANSDNSYIKTLAKQKNELESKLIESSEIMTAPLAGLISYRVDGFENILTVNDTKDFSYITKDILDSVDIKSGSLIPINIEQGKIIDNFEYYVAVYMDTDRASFAEVGESVKLRIASTTTVDAQIQAINHVPGEDEARIIVFKINDDIEKYLEYRKVQIDVIWWEYDGLKVINSAIIEEDGKSYIYRNKLGTVEKIYIKVLRQNESYSIVENFEDEELIEKGYSKDEIKKRNKINLYDKVIVNENKKK